MITYTQIIGSVGKTNTGIIVLNSENQLSSLDDVTSSGRWRDSTPRTPTLPSASTQGICGNIVNGAIYFEGTTISHLSSVGNPHAKWKALTSPTLISGIVGMVGDSISGLTAFGNGMDSAQQVIQWSPLPPNDPAPVWKAKQVPPFNVKLIAGDNINGLLIVGTTNVGQDNVVWQISQSGPDCNCDWAAAISVPFGIELICGDVLNGFVLYGEGQMITFDPKTKIQKPVPSLNFSITAMTGNPKDGVAAILVGGTVAFTSDPSKSTWTVLGGPLPEVPVSALAAAAKVAADRVASDAKDVFTANAATIAKKTADEKVAANVKAKAEADSKIKAMETSVATGTSLEMQSNPS